jgi:hypothetical protein
MVVFVFDLLWDKIVLVIKKKLKFEAGGQEFAKKSLKKDKCFLPWILVFSLTFLAILLHAFAIFGCELETCFCMLIILKVLTLLKLQFNFYFYFRIVQYMQDFIIIFFLWGYHSNMYKDLRIQLQKRIDLTALWQS